jgi:exosome complex protein LRP1
MEERKEQGAIDTLESCHSNLNTIEDCMNHLLEDNRYEKCYDQLASIEKAKLDVGVAYGLASLLFITLKSQGMPASDHPIKDDLNRIKKYVAKIKEMEQQQQPSATDERKVTVNPTAAKRVISHQIGSKKKTKSK